MGTQYKEKGGGPAVGLANDYVSMLQSLLNTGGIGPAGAPNAPAATGSIAGILQDVLAGGKGQVGANIQELLTKSQERNVNALRARFGAAGGASFGTPAAFAEGFYRGEAAPQIAQAITGMQLNALGTLLPQIAQFAQKGITQREGFMQPSGFAQALGTIAPVAQAALPFLLPGFPSAAAGGASQLAGLGPNIAGGGIGNQTQSGGGLYSGGTGGYIDPTYQGQGYLGI